MGKMLLVSFIFIMLCACAPQPIGFIIIQEDTPLLKSTPYAIQEVKDLNQVKEILSPDTKLEILSNGFGKDFMFFKVRTLARDIGYVIYDKGVDYTFYNQNN